MGRDTIQPGVCPISATIEPHKNPVPGWVRKEPVPGRAWGRLKCLMSVAMTQFVVVTKPNPHLPHNSEELQSPPPEDAANDEIAQKNAELIISQIMTEQPRIEGPKNRTAMPKAAPQSHQIQAETAPIPTQAPDPAPAAPAAARRRGADALPPLRPADAEEVRLRDALTEDDEIFDDNAQGGLLSRVRPAYAIVGVLAIMALLWPVATGLILLLVLWLTVLFVMALKRAVAGGRWTQFARRHPTKAERLRRTADRMAEKLDMVLDYLPGGLADMLAMPDLSQPVVSGRHVRGGRH